MNRQKETQANSITYRPEIDGLRAIAVLSVVLYHAGIGPANGFVGVDIFFVISGYLITALLHKEWTNTGQIAIFDFYARRFRRLFAALVLVVISTVVISILVLSPYGEIKQVTQSAAASMVFVSNIFFEMTTGGYFDDSAETLPLLHLWSLAVEEQFYLVWPILLVLILRLRPNALVWIIIVLAVGSLLYAEFLITENQEAAFYRMPARFWELAIGGVIALLPSGQLRNGESIASFGLFTLLVAVTIPMAQFPGIGALPAVAGAALLLFAIHGTTRLGIAGGVLSSRSMVFFGLISYSLYLWHWPLLAIDKATRAGASPVEIRVLLCIIAILLAWLSYRFVERPFRRANPDTPGLKVVVAGITASIVLAVAGVIVGDRFDWDPLPNDLASRTSRDMPENRHSCHYQGLEPLSTFPKPGCNSIPDTPADVVIWGDSMALAWQPFAWAIGQQANMAATSYSRDACPPVHNYSNGKNQAEDMRCREFNELVMNKVRGIDTLILSSAWGAISGQGINRTADIEFKAGLMDTIQEVSRYVNKIILLGPTPRLPDTAPRCIRASSLDSCAVSRTTFDAQTLQSRRFLASVAENYDTVTFIDLADFFCTTDICPVLKDGYSLYWDSYHVSSTAARNFAAEYLGKTAY